MRQLHPVSLKEKFVASGLYTIKDDVQSAPLTEEWTIHQLPDDSEIMRVDRMLSSSRTLLLEVYRTANGQIERFDAYLYASGGSLSHQVKATYARFDDTLYVTRTLSDGTQHQETLNLLPTTMICPPAWVFLGNVVKAVAVADAEVITADLDDSTPEHLFTATREPLTAIPVATGYKQVAGREIEVQGYHVQGQGYDDRSIFWVDPYQTLISLEHQAAETVRLTRYSRRLEPGHHA